MILMLTATLSSCQVRGDFPSYELEFYTLEDLLDRVADTVNTLVDRLSPMDPSEDGQDSLDRYPVIRPSRDPEVVDPGEDPNGFQNDRIPGRNDLAMLGFAGSEVRLLTWDEAEAWTFPKEDSVTDSLKSRLYYHYFGVAERLDITFRPTWCPANTSKQAEFLTAARADDANYDLIQTQSLFPVILATEGRLCNLLRQGYPDLEMPWWPNSMDDWTQAGSLFFVASNSSAMGISNMSVVFVNDGLITAKGAPSPVQSVLRGVWTVEEMTKISKTFAGAAENADESSRIYGFVIDHGSRASCLYYACGFNSVINNANGVGEYGFDDESELEAITKALNKFESIMTGPEVVIHGDDSITEMNEGRTAMLLGFMQHVRTLERTEEYTVVPLPMLDEKQYDTMGYRTVHRDLLDVWCIPTTTANKALSGIVLEANASSEYRLIAPFYYEQYLKDRYANGADGRACFDILRESVIYDFGRVGLVGGIGCEWYWNACFEASGASYFNNAFATSYRGEAGAKQQNLQKVLDDFAKYVDN